MSNSAHGPGAIVLGGNFVGLGVVRSLGRRGIPVWVIDRDRGLSIAQFSRYTSRFIECKEGLSELLLREAEKHDLNGWVLFPVTDEYVESVARHYELLSSTYRLTTAPLAVTQFALDKRLTYRRGDELGISTPWTLMSDSLKDFEPQDLPYPVILKPAINHHFFPYTNIKALPATTPVELRGQYARMSSYIPGDEILIQEHIPGSGESQFSYCAACNSGRVYASLVAQRRRQYPVEFGNASSFVETIDQPEVEAAGKKFFESIGFDGIGELEFKFDSRDGKYKLLDFNPRTWGWHGLGKAAGIDFVYLLWKQKSGLENTPIGRTRHAAWLREITDLVAIASSSDPLAEIKDLFSAVINKRLQLATFDLLDPAPFFAEIALSIRGTSRRERAKVLLGQRSPRTSRESTIPETAGMS